MDTLFVAFALLGVCLVVAAVALAILTRGRPAVAAAVSGVVFLALAGGVAILVHNTTYEDCVTEGSVRTGLDDPFGGQARFNAIVSRRTGVPQAVIARDSCRVERVLDGVLGY